MLWVCFRMQYIYIYIYNEKVQSNRNHSYDNENKNRLLYILDLIVKKKLFQRGGQAVYEDNN